MVVSPGITVGPKAYIRKFPEWRDIPKVCDNCTSPGIRLASNQEVYGRVFGTWSMIYLCNSCRAYVGCHPGSIYPLGTMADKATRVARAEAHGVIDPLWQQGHWDRKALYKHLGELMQMEDPSKFHVGELSAAQAHSAAALALDLALALDFK